MSRAVVNYDPNEIAYYDQSQPVYDPQNYTGAEGAEEGAVVEYYEPPAGHHDHLGRLLKDPQDIIDPETLPEEIPLFVSMWQKQHLSAQMDWAWTSKFVWPDIQRTVLMKRLDIFQQDNPLLQYATTDGKESITVRTSGDWYPVRSLFFLDDRTDNTCELLVEVAGPPRRSKFRLGGKQNKRDLLKWSPKETLHCFLDPHFAQGLGRIYIDYCDLPDRYFLSTSPEPGVGLRRLYQFGAYTATQYFILEKRVYHEALDAEGGWGTTYWLEAGPILHAKKDWRLIGSFFGFDKPLPSSCKFSVYRRTDPFPRMYLAREVIQNAHEWSVDFEFYAFDIAVPGTVRYSLHHCLRSIYNNKASVPRHRLTTEDHRTPWEFRMNLFVFPANLKDCTIRPYIHQPEAYRSSSAPPSTSSSSGFRHS